MNLPSILLWGFAATVVLTTLTIAGQSLGLTRIDIPFIVGTMVTADRDRAKVIGFALHLFNGSSLPDRDAPYSSRDTLDEGRATYLPNLFSLNFKEHDQRPDEARPIDVFLCAVTPPDCGRCRRDSCSTARPGARRCGG